MPNAVAGVMRLLDCFMKQFLPAEGEEPNPELEQEIAERVSISPSTCCLGRGGVRGREEREEGRGQEGWLGLGIECRG